MGDPGIRLQHPGDLLRIGAAGVLLLVEDIVYPRVPGDLHHAQAIGAVGRNEQLIPRSHHAGEDRLHPEGAAALYEHGGVLRLSDMAQLQQRGADALGDLLVVVVPGTVVKEHLRLHGIRGGQRSGCEQLIAIHGSQSSLLL